MVYYVESYKKDQENQLHYHVCNIEIPCNCCRDSSVGILVHQGYLGT